MKSPGVTCIPLQGIDQTQHPCEVAFARVSIPLDQMLGARDTAWPALQRPLDKAVVALCAEMVGGAERAMEMCVEYAKTRVQFGRPIGSFQAVKHKIADMKLLFPHDVILTTPMGCLHVCVYTDNAPASLVAEHVSIHLRDVEHRTA